MEKNEAGKQEKDRKRVLVPVRSRETTQREECAEEPNQAKVRKVPRRWHIF